MRSLKTTGGLTRGRGMTQTQRNVWVMSSPVTAEVNQAMQQLTSVKYTTGEQHKDLFVARQKRDSSDVNKLIDFLQDKTPFDKDGSLRNVVIGVLATEKVNVTKAKEVRETILNGLVGKQVVNYVFRKKDRVVTMESKSKIRIDGEDVHIDPELLFQRLVLIGTQKDNLKDAFRYELCGFPPALFERRSVLLKANKPVLANAIWSIAPPISDDETRTLGFYDSKYVLDGGALMHKIPWQTGQTFDFICQQYVLYVLKKYKQLTVVFDGYESGPAPKDGTQSRRGGSAAAARDVLFTPNMQLQTKKEDFLSSKKNKQNFINMLSGYLVRSNCQVHHADGDADVLIVSTALKVAETCTTIVVGDDTDLVILLCHHATSKHKKIFFHPEPKSGQQDRYMDIYQARSALGEEVCRDLLFVHAILGCDTTLRLFVFGKAVGLKFIKNNQTFIKQAKVFNRRGCTQDEVTVAAEKVIMCLYKSSMNIANLNQLRHQKFLELMRTSKKAIEPKNLPPTSASIMFHSMRVYYQIQTWKNIKLDAEEWGWKIMDRIMVPQQTGLDAAPKELLEFVRCHCKTGCSTKHCSCKKIGLPCLTACSECKGICENMGEGDTEIDDTDDTEIGLEVENWHTG